VCGLLDVLEQVYEFTRQFEDLEIDEFLFFLPFFLTMIKQKALQRGIDLLIEMDGCPVNITADECKVRQVQV